VRMPRSTGITALHAAVQKEGHLDVVVALLEHGADVDCTTAKGNTALMYAPTAQNAPVSCLLCRLRRIWRKEHALFENEAHGRHRLMRRMRDNAL
jgi:hypothetical protein